MDPSTSNHRSQPEHLAERLFAGLQYVLPHHFLSSLMYRVTRVEWPIFKNALIRKVIRWYRIDMQEAQEPDPVKYRSFNAFFTRALKPAVRPIDGSSEVIISPADGTLSQVGEIDNGRVFQAKGHDFSLLELLGGDRAWSQQFEEGSFTTVYLSPRDYHRVHMPFGGTLIKMIHIPGRLFSVNAATTRQIPGLFARNERVACLFNTELGPMAVILIGAIFVSSIETQWAGTVTPVSRQIRRWDYPPLPAAEPVRLEKGEELGRFNMGSTVILLFGKDAVEWEDALEPGQPLKMGERLAKLSLRDPESH
ncbi:MAG: archaetidylserine decarboxylase [Gammaproteobacteria bacterium]|nr:archaetidylserine decarboxylase [Gammaproteobacteria bacterium]